MLNKLLNRPSWDLRRFSIQRQEFFKENCCVVIVRITDTFGERTLDFVTQPPSL